MDYTSQSVFYFSESILQQGLIVKNKIYEGLEKKLKGRQMYVDVSEPGSSRQNSSI